MLDYIGLENFRVFKERQDFKFAPITILTGPNGSGKSSIIKAIQLLEGHNLSDYLDFSKGQHQLGTFQEAVNKQRKKDPISFYFQLNFFELDDSLTVKLSYNDAGVRGKLSNIEVSETNTGTKVEVEITFANDPINRISIF